jgi:RHS repeat-associated protein
MSWYDAAWRVVQETQRDQTNGAGTLEESVIQQVWGVRYIIEAVAAAAAPSGARIAKASRRSGERSSQELAFQLTDAQFSVIAVATPGKPGVVIDRNGVINQVDYDISIADYDISIADYDISIADDGKSSSGGVGEAGLFSRGVRNSIGYCGYVFNEDSGLYTVRFRTYSPTLGRWLERDPAGYVDGMGLYEYVRGGAIDAVDPSGLEPPDTRSAEKRRSDMCRAIRDGRKSRMSLDDFLKKYATTFGDQRGVFYQTHGTFEGKDIDIDWLLTLLYSNRHHRIDFEAVALPGSLGASPWLLYHVGKAVWIVLDSVNDPNRHIDDFAKRYRQQEELDTIDLADRILANEVNIYAVLEKMAGCPTCPDQERVGPPDPPMALPAATPQSPGWASPPPVAPRRGRLGVDGVFTIPPKT